MSALQEFGSQSIVSSDAVAPHVVTTPNWFPGTPVGIQSAAPRRPVRPIVAEWNRIALPSAELSARVDMSSVQIVGIGLVKEICFQPNRPSVTLGVGTPGRSVLADLWTRDSTKSAADLRPVEVASQPGGISTELPLPSIVWGLIQTDRLAAARKLLETAPETPKIQELRRLLREPTARVEARKDRNRSDELTWLQAHSKDYRNRWIAVEGATLVAAGATLRELRQTLKTQHAGAHPLIHFVE